jgi:hypothetical protein
MKPAIFKKWTFYRLVRMAIGLAIMVQGFILKDVFLGAAGLLFTSMAIFNWGCCGIGECSAVSRKSDKDLKEISYEEVV